MTKPQAYRHKTTGTIAYTGKEYPDWKSIAPVLNTFDDIKDKPHEFRWSDIDYPEITYHIGCLLFFVLAITFF